MTEYSLQHAAVPGGERARRRVEAACGSERKPSPHDRETMLEHLRVLLRRHGRLSGDLIDAEVGGPRARAYEWYFGSLGYAYQLVGFKARGGRSVEPSAWRRAIVESALQSVKPLPL